MKFIYPILCIMLLPFAPAISQTSYPSGVTGCIARWDFTSTTSFTTLPDVSGNSNAGSTNNVGTSSGWRGVSNTAGHFDNVGTPSYVAVTNNTMLSPSAITIVALVKASSYNSAGCQYNTVLLKGSNYNVAGCYGMSIFDNDNNCAILGTKQTVDFISSAPNIPFSGNDMMTGNWYFMATTYDGTFMKRYQVPMSATTYYPTLGPTSQGPVSTPLGTNSSDIRIGQNPNSSPSYISPFSGDMDEIVLFNKGLSDAEVQSVYNYLWGGVTIDKPFTDTLICPGAPFTLKYTVVSSGAFNTGNSFTAEISDALGSFVSPTPIGSTSSNTSGTIACTMPPSASGTGYRIRIKGTNPSYISPDNGKDIAIGHPAIAAAITASPGAVVANNTPVIFTSDVPYKGTTATYTWKKNAITIAGATAATYNATSSTDFKNNDTITVSVKINDTYCAFTDSTISNKIGMSVGLGVQNVSNSHNLNVYPNPNSGSFNITGQTLNNKPLAVEVLNAMGQVIYKNNWIPVNNKLNNQVKLENAPAGTYMLRTTSDDGVSAIRFSINK